MKHEGGSVNNCNWCLWNVPKKLWKDMEGIRNQRKNRDHIDHSIVKIGLNTHRIPRDSRRLAGSEVIIIILGTIQKNLEKILEKLSLLWRSKKVKTISGLISARILRRDSENWSDLNQVLLKWKSHNPTQKTINQSNPKENHSIQSKKQSPNPIQNTITESNPKSNHPFESKRQSSKSIQKKIPQSNQKDNHPI